MTKKPPIALKGKWLINGNNKEVLEDAVVIIDDSRIQAVGREKEIKVPNNATMLEFDNCVLMPGLIDTHLHLAAQNALSFNNHRVAMLELTPQLQMLYALHHAQICFEMGFTTLRDMSWASYSGWFTAEMVAIRDGINLGIFSGPRLLVSGWTIITGSHLDRFLPRSVPRNNESTGDGPWELRKLARKNLRDGCDFIKTCASGGISYGEYNIRNMTQVEIDAIVDEAHAFGKPCACHCFTAESQKMAVKAGMDTIEHCIFTDDEAITMMKETDKVIIPTLAHRSDRALEVRRRVGAPELILKSMKEIQPYAKETFQKVYQAGIKIACGTDIEIDPEMGSNAYELEIYVDYGMTPMEAIQTATKNAAEAIWMSSDIGTLEIGKFADIIAVEGNPLEDIRIFQNKDKIKMVMKEGNIFIDKRAGVNKNAINAINWR